jgi:YD repeat-containing protein
VRSFDLKRFFAMDILRTSQLIRKSALARTLYTIFAVLAISIFTQSTNIYAQELPSYCKQNSSRTDFGGDHCDVSKLKVGKYFWINDIGPGFGSSREAYDWVASNSSDGTNELIALPGQCDNSQLEFSSYFGSTLGIFYARPCIFGKVSSGIRQPNDTAPAWSSAEAFCPAGWAVAANDRNGSRGLPGVCISRFKPKMVGQDCQPTCGNPISIGSGNKYQREVDYVNGTLIVERHYNSAGSDAQINIGNKWRFGFDRTVRANLSASWIDVQRPDGRIFSYKENAGAFQVDGDVSDRLTRLLDAGGNMTGWQISADKSQEIEKYSLDGKLVSIKSLGGSSNFFTYTGNKLTTISDQFGRQINLQYDASGRVSGFTDPNGGTYSYQYVTVNPVDPMFRAPTTLNPAYANLAQVTYPDNTFRQYQYDFGVATLYGFQSALTGIVDEKGAQYASFRYGSGGQANLAVSTEHFGGVEKYSIALSGGAINILDVTDPLGTVRKYWFETIQGIPRLVTLEQPCSTPGCSGTVRSTQTYDANANITSRTDFRGIKSTYTYDLTRNLETQRTESISLCPASSNFDAYNFPVTSCTIGTCWSTTQFLGSISGAIVGFNSQFYACYVNTARVTSTTWHPTYRLPATITEPVTVNGVGNKVTTNTYDTNGNLAQRQVTTPSGTRTWAWTYDQYGRVLTATDPLGRINTNTYNPNTEAQNQVHPYSRGMLASVTNPLGHTTNITSYNPHGQPLTMVDANGLTTSMTYDTRQRLTSRTVGGETTAYEYELTGKLSKVILPDNSTLSYTYDGAQRLTQIQDTLGNKIIYTLDNMGNRIAESARDPNGALTRTRSRVFDPLNRLQKDIGGATPTTQINQYAYDNNGNQTSMTDPLVRITTNTYDALNRLTQVTDPNTPVGLTKYEYDAQDNLTKVTDPKSLATTYSYNGFNELISQTSPDTGLTSFTYDNNGNMLTKTDARNITVAYGYDNLNRVTAINYPAVLTNPTVPAQTITYTYDTCNNGKGRLCSVTDRTGTTTYTYDNQGRITAKAQTLIGAFTSPTQTVAYRYNAAGQMDQMTLPSGKKVAVSYLNNRITGLTVDGTPIVKSADYEPFGSIGEWTWGNDTVTTANKHTRYFDLDGRNTKIESGNINGAIDPNLIVYDAASRIVALQRLSNPTTNTIDPTKSITYSYDSLDRLTTVAPTAGNPAIAQSYTYDAIGNRLTNNIAGSTTTYSYGSASHRLNALTGATTKTFTYDNVGNRVSDGIQSWIYGGDNRPSAISVSGSSPITIQSGINALGQRVLKNVNNSQSGTITRFVYDEAGRLIGEYDSTGRPLQETIWLNDLPVAVLK